MSVHLRVRSWRFPSESRMTEGFTFSKNTNSISQYGTHRFTVRSYRGGPSRGPGPCARTRDFAFWILIFPARIVRIDISIIEFLAMVIRTEPGTAPGMVTTHQSFEVRCVVHSQWLYFTRRTQDTSIPPVRGNFVMLTWVYASTGQFALSKIRVAYV